MGYFKSKMNHMENILTHYTTLMHENGFTHAYGENSTDLDQKISGLMQIMQVWLCHRKWISQNGKLMIVRKINFTRQQLLNVEVSKIDMKTNDALITEDVIVCDTCENEYVLKHVRMTLEEAQSLDVWSCGVCLGTHVSSSSSSSSSSKKKTRKKRTFVDSQQSSPPTIPNVYTLRTFKGFDLQPEALLKVVTEFGGINVVRTNRKWQGVRQSLNLPYCTSASYTLNTIYMKYFEESFPISQQQLIGSQQLIPPPIPTSYTLRRYKGYDLHPDVLLEGVTEFGGVDVVRAGRKWQDVRRSLNLPPCTSAGYTLNTIYHQYFEEALPPTKVRDTGRPFKKKKSTQSTHVSSSSSSSTSEKDNNGIH